MGFPLSPILADIYMHYFENTLFEKISFPFWTRYVDDTFTLIDTSLHNIDTYIWALVNLTKSSVHSFSVKIQYCAAHVFF